MAGAGQQGAVTIATNMANRGTDIKLGKDLDLTAEEADASTSSAPSVTSRGGSTAAPGPLRAPGQSGSSLFFLSLEDELMRLFMADRVARYMDKTGAEEGEVITGKLVTRAIESAQKRVELQNFQQRKRLLEYDDVMNQQREGHLLAPALRAGAGRGLKAEARR
ncbi:MAG: hypothetical protein R2909_22650 [Gemmatimonadales bacterium]